MNETFTERLLELQKDPGYFNPQKLEKLKIVFDRVCQEMGIADIQKDQRQRDKLATINFQHLKLNLILWHLGGPWTGICSSELPTQRTLPKNRWRTLLLSLKAY